MNFLRRRFSSGDLQGELKDRDENINVLNFKKGPSPSAPSSPSRSTSVSGMTHPGANKPPYNKDRCKILLVVDDQHTDWWVAPWQWLIYRKYWWCNRYQEWVLRNTERNVCKTSLDNRKYQEKVHVGSICQRLLFVFKSASSKFGGCAIEYVIIRLCLWCSRFVVDSQSYDTMILFFFSVFN